MDCKDTLTLDLFLRQQTQEQHRKTEKALAPLDLMGKCSLSQYRSFISLQYHWHKTLENAFDFASISSDAYTYHSKIEMLFADLDSLGVQPAQLSDQDFKPNAIPGIVYTLDGSMMGGVMINRHLSKIGIEEKHRNYLTFCEKEAPKIWPATRKYLRGIPNQDDYYNECLETSRACFELMIKLSTNPKAVLQQSTLSRD